MKTIQKRPAAKLESPQVLLNNLRFDEVIPSCDSGFGLLQNVYSGGRIGVVVNFFGGLTSVEYWGTLPMHHFSRVLFKGDPASAYTRCFRAQLMIGDDPYNLEFSNTSHFCYGYRSHFAVPDLGVEVVHRLTLLNDALVFSIEVLRNEHNLPLRQRFEHHEHSFNGARGRTRTDWKEDVVPSGWVMTAKDIIPDDVWQKFQAELGTRNELNFPNGLAQGPREGTAWIALFNDRGLSTRTNKASRRYFTGKEFRRGDQATVLLFASSRKELAQRAKELRRKAVAIVKAKERDAYRSLAKAPQIQTGDKILDSMIANVPLVYESLFVEDIPGTAGTAIAYHIWGWDTLNCPDMHLLSGQVDFVRDAIRFYRETAHPKWGLGHQYTTDMPPKVRIPMPYPAQSVYLVFLYQYGSYVDRSLWRESYAFAKKIFLATLGLINDRGLGEGLALWPDIPAVCGHNGNDISVFNNSIQYQGMRCFEEMAVYAGDKKSAEKARKVCRLMEKNFVPTFWDKKRGYFADSVDSKTGQQRPSYPAHALLWMTPFLHDLVSPEKLKACASFMDKNHTSLRGYLPYPRWDVAFDGDGNQLGQVWPTHDMFVTRCAAAAGRQDMLEFWIEMSDWFWKQLGYIEGYSAQTVNDSGTLDCTGSKMNFFGTKTTYMAFFTGCAGLHFDVGGITLSEGIARPLSVKQVPFRGAKLDFSLKGKGKFAGKLLVKGKLVVGSLKIPITLLKGKVVIRLERTVKSPAHPVILSLYGAEVRKVGVDPSGNLQAVVFGNTPAWLRYYSPKPTKILFDGREITGEYDRSTREGKILLPLSSAAAQVEIGESSGKQLLQRRVEGKNLPLPSPYIVKKSGES